MTRAHTSRACLLLLGIAAGGGCAPREGKVVAATESSQTRIAHSLDVDTTRLVATGGGKPDEALGKLVAAHLMTVGQLRAPQITDKGRELTADLPTPGYALRAVIENRPDEYCLLVLEAVLMQEGKETVVPEAPWWVIDSLESAYRELRALSPPRRAVMTPQRFERLRSQAEEAARRGGDQPISAEMYSRSPRPVMNPGDAPYWSPVIDGPSVLGPRSKP